MHLDLSIPGIEAPRLCAFRQQILASQTGIDALQGVIDRLGGFAAPQKTPADVGQVMAAICLPSRAETIFECMSVALEALATRDPEWLKTNTEPHWYKRYHRKLGQPKIPSSGRDMESLVESVGRDGQTLLAAVERSDRSKLAQLPEILALRREWQRQFELQTTPLKLRDPYCQLCGAYLRSVNDNSRESEGGPTWRN